MMGKKGGQFFSSITIPAAKKEIVKHQNKEIVFGGFFVNR